MSEDKKLENMEAVELADEVFEEVSGGAGLKFMNIACPHCGKVNIVNIAASGYLCKKCHAVNEISG